MSPGLTVLWLLGQRPKDRLPLPKFSQLVKRMVLEADRNPGIYSDGNAAEVRLWSCGLEEVDLLMSTKRPGAQTPPMNVPLWETGDTSARTRIIFYLSTTNPPSTNFTPTSVSPRSTFG